MITNGQSVRRLNSEEQWASAIAERRLTRERWVGVERDGMPVTRIRAGEVPELVAIFDRFEPPTRREIVVYVRCATSLTSGRRTQVLAQLQRGERVSAWVYGPDYVLATEGQVEVIAGGRRGVVAASALSVTPPPGRQRSAVQGPQEARREAQVFREPDLQGPPIGLIAPRMVVQVVARVETDGPYELLLDGPRVGYAAVDILTEPPLAIILLLRRIDEILSGKGALPSLDEPAPPPQATGSRRVRLLPWLATACIMVAVVGFIAAVGIEFSRSDPPPPRPAVIVSGVRLYATRAVYIRSLASMGSPYSAVLKRGEAVSAEPGGGDGEVPWFKITLDRLPDCRATGCYVSGLFLSSSARPTLVSPPARRLFARTLLSLRTEPGGPVPAAIRQIQPGEAVTLEPSGNEVTRSSKPTTTGVAGGWLEIVIGKKSVVGYAPLADFSETPLRLAVPRRATTPGQANRMAPKELADHARLKRTAGDP